MSFRIRLRSVSNRREDMPGRSSRKTHPAIRYKRPPSYRPSPRPARILAIVPVIAVAAALTGLVLAGRSSALGGPPAYSCTGQMSSAKCRAVQQAAPGLPPERSSATAAGLAPGTAGVIDCGAAFFTAAEARQLTSTFGLISCFRFTGQDQWILLGNGMSTAGPGSAGAPGGPVVAVEHCPSGDATCLNPDATRSFSSFVVTRPPDPLARPLELQTVAGNSVLVLSSAHCGLFSFDVRSLQWYGGSAAAIHALLAHPGGERPITTIPAMTGAQALVARPPAGPPAGCRPGLG
jgi:hypothetical protein